MVTLLHSHKPVTPSIVQFKAWESPLLGKISAAAYPFRFPGMLLSVIALRHHPLSTGESD